MPKWTEKTAVSTLSASDKVLCAQSSTNKTCTMENISNFVEGVISERVFGYLSTAANTTLTTANEWYVLNSTFTNSIIEGFTAAATGITYTGSGAKFEAEFMTAGQSSTTATIKIALVKNGTFDEYGMLTVGDILAGSEGLDECTTVSAASGFGNPRGLWAGTLATDDKITIVISSNVDATTWTPNHANASIHRFL